VTWHPVSVRALAVSTDARLTRDSIESYAFGLAWRTTSTSSRWPVEIIARLDTDKGLRRGAFALGLSIGGENRFGAVASAPAMSLGSMPSACTDWCRGKPVPGVARTAVACGCGFAA